MIADYYQNSVRETGSATRWAFEIYTTFLATAAVSFICLSFTIFLSFKAVKKLSDSLMQAWENFLPNFISLGVRWNHFSWSIDLDFNVLAFGNGTVRSQFECLFTISGRKLSVVLLQISL